MKRNETIVDFMMSKGLLGKSINTTALFQGEILFGMENHSEYQERKQ